MESHSPISFRPFIASAVIMFVFGWGGLALVVTLTEPLVWWRWTFFALWILALTGAALPVIWFLNLRFPSGPSAEAHVIARQAIWFGVYGAILAWLEMSLVVTLGIAMGLAVGITAIEYLIRMRERSQWKPPQAPAESEQAAPVPEPTDG